MVVRQFEITDKKRPDYKQVYDGHFLQDGSGDAKCLTSKGYEVLYSWEFKLK